MKSFMEKVKNNKLRSVCIGLSAFLFGFIVVSVFNNIDDTYATSDSTGKCYVCGGTQSGSYKWGDYSSNSGCNIQTQYTDRSSCLTANPAACYVCGGTQSGSYKWGKLAANSSCTAQTQYTSESSCLNNNGYTWKFYSNTTTSGTYGATWTGYGSGYYQGDGSVIISCSGSSCSSIKTIPSIKRTGFKFVGWSQSSTCSSIAKIDTSRAMGYNATFYACWQKADACYVCGNSQNGSYKWGAFAGNSSCNIQTDYTTENACLDNNPDPAPSQNPDDFTGDGSSSGGSSSGEPEPDAIAETIQYYKIVYDLDGGKLIDGKTSKTQYVRGDKAVGTPGTNPIKDGYAFIQWEYNGNSFDFNTKLDDIKSSLSTTTENGVTIYTITLKATYIEFDYTNMECPSGTVLDPSVRKCYSVLNDSSYPLYTLTSYSAGTRYCYAYNNSQGKPGGITIYSTAKADCPTIGNAGTGSAGLCNIEGKNNKTDGKYSEYGKNDAWMSKNSCFVASTCTAELTNSSACEIRWDTILYNVSDANIKENVIPVESVDEDFSDSDGSADPDDSSNNKEDTNNKDKTDDELTNNSKTGDTLIFVAWVIGIGALAYSVYYFKLKKENI